MICWVSCAFPPDSEFAIGTRQAAAQRVAAIINAEMPDRELNEVLTPTSEFYIARYPVNVAQFRAFVEATGFEIGDARALQDPDNRPARWVSWHEALAYCDWLNDCLACAPAFEGSEMARRVREGGWRVVLPSELEWEKAARGGLRDAVFAWGDEPDPNRANYQETGIGDTSTVGCFPANGYGLYDLIDSVWEWTRSHYSAYPYCAEDGRENLATKENVLRVLRGGSRGNVRDYERSSSCAGNPPRRPILQRRVSGGVAFGPCFVTRTSGHSGL